MELSIRALLERIPGQSWDHNWCARGIAHYDKRRYLKALNAWNRASEEGSSEAQYRIGLLYARGEGVVRSAPDAVAWYKRAAQAGHTEAQYQLGLTYLNGANSAETGPENWFQAVSKHDGEAAQRAIQVLFPNGITVEKDLDEAMRWMCAAATAGKAEAQALLGDMYRRGLGCTQDYEQAQHWYRLAAQQGVASAQFAMGDIYYQGLGIAVDRALAADWYEKGAKGADPRAQVALGFIYLAGDGRPADPNEAARLFVLAAERGEARGLYQAALMHIKGEWLPESIDKGETYLRRSAKRDYLPAIISLAELYARGKGVEPDLRESAEWYRRAVQLGDVQSQFIMGRLYATGAGVPVNYRESARWLLRAAEQGHATAAHNVAAHFANGTGVERDPVKAIEWYKAAAAKGITASQVQLGKMYSVGEGVARDLELASEWLRKAAESGDPDAKVSLAMLHLQGSAEVDNPSEAERLLRQAAESGHPAAAMQLARLYAGNAKPNDAATWYLKAAEAGHVEAQYALGMLYFKRRGSKTGLAAAANWIAKAAHGDHAPAQFQLAVMYCTAEGVPKDLEKAVAWYERAARSGHTVAQYNLAVMLSKGQGCESDPPQALSWFQKAAAQGMEQARIALGSISPEAPPAAPATANPASGSKADETPQDRPVQSGRPNEDFAKACSGNLFDAKPDLRSPERTSPDAINNVTPLRSLQAVGAALPPDSFEPGTGENTFNEPSNASASTPPTPIHDLVQHSTGPSAATQPNGIENPSATAASIALESRGPEEPSTHPAPDLAAAGEDSQDAQAHPDQDGCAQSISQSPSEPSPDTRRHIVDDVQANSELVVIEERPDQGSAENQSGQPAGRNVDPQKPAEALGHAESTQESSSDRSSRTPQEGPPRVRPKTVDFELGVERRHSDVPMARDSASADGHSGFVEDNSCATPDPGVAPPVSDSFTPSEPTALPKKNDGIERSFLETDMGPEEAATTHDPLATGPLTPDVDRPGSAPDALTGVFVGKKRQVRSKAEIRIALGLDRQPESPGPSTELTPLADQTIRGRNRSEPKSD